MHGINQNRLPRKVRQKVFGIAFQQRHAANDVAKFTTLGFGAGHAIDQ
jgi:hypothetical protein